MDLKEEVFEQFKADMKKAKTYQDLMGDNGAIKKIIKASLEGILDAELTEHLCYEGSAFIWDEERRFLIRCELDALYFKLYGLNREEVDYVMETFPIVKRKDIEKYGEYRTKRVILEIFDEMLECERTGRKYQTRLDPPPADPSVAHKE